MRGFVIGELLDEGGYGKVYHGKQPVLGRDAVIKVLHPRWRIDDVKRQRFLREAQVASKLDHPYAAHIYAFDVEPDGLSWIAMEFVQGTTLKHWLRDRGPMSIEQLVPLFDIIAEVVQSAHEHGIVHRDLKPSNVMVIERGGRWFPKLLDFGVAKLLEGVEPPDSTPDTIKRMRELSIEKPPEEILKQFREDGPSTATGTASSPNEGRLTPDGATIGTPEYMAPEQWSHEFPVGRAADLYALAVVVFEALTGRRPFEGMSIEELAEMHATGTVPSFRGSFPPALDQALDQMFQRAFAKRPEDRFGTALELAGALRAASGLGASPSDLPRIDAGVRDAWLAGAPQPLAESVAVLDSARNAHQAHTATQELVRNLLRYLLAVALATRAKTPEGKDDPALLDLVRALDRHGLSTEERVRLLRLLLRPLIGRRGDHPIPVVVELVDLVAPGPDGADGLDPILALHSTLDYAGAEDIVRSRLGRLMPELTQLLRTTTFVLDYVLVVPRDHVAERWTGVHRQRTPATVIDGELIESHPMLLDRNARVCVDLMAAGAGGAPDG